MEFGAVSAGECTMAPKRDQKKRLGKKHRQASTRPKLGKSAPRGTAVTGAVSPKKRKEIAAKKAAAAKAKLTPTRSPDNERRKVIGDAAEPGAAPRKADRYKGDDDSRRKGSHIVGGPQYRGVEGEDAAERAGWREAAILAEQLTLATTGASSEVAAMALVAICGRPNVGKSTLFNRLTGTRRSIVGDEPGITRDRIYGEVEWNGRTVRLVDTGGVVPDDEALIPAEIFRQARVALEEADATVMVVDGRSELAAPDLELAKLLMRGGKPVFLAVNKIDAPELLAAAENFRRLGFRNVVPVSAEHGAGIGDLLDEVWAVLPEEGHTQEDLRAEFIQRESIDLIEGLEEEELEDMGGGGDALAPPPEPLDEDAEPTKERRLRSHGEHVLRETKVAIIGRPNVGKSSLLNALTGSDRAIVSPIAGTTRDAIDELVIRNGQALRLIDTAGIRRKGKTRLMAEKLSVVMARRHLESADIALLVLDATAGVTALDANIGGYAHESGRSVIIVVNKWDLLTAPAAAAVTRLPHASTKAFSGKDDAAAPLMLDRRSAHEWESKKSASPKASQKIFESQLRDRLKFLDYAPVVFLSAASGRGLDALYRAISLVARERRKRISTGQINRFLARTDFQQAPVPLNRRVKIYYITQAAVAPPTFVLFTDKDVPLHFSFERFLANQFRAAFNFTGTPLRFLTRPRNKKSHA